MTNTAYSRFLLFIAGLGGLLYGVDVGIIAAALLYLNHTIELSLTQESLVVAAVLGGGMVGSLVAGVVADWIGRKRMMLASGALFIVSIVVIVLSHGFGTLMTGRLLQGASGGVIGVVAPLYLAESLGAEIRGRGTAIFQFMLTFGIVAAALVGWHYTRQAETAIAAAAGNAALILAAQNHAWRSMFLVVIYPGILFFLGTFALSETPRWLVRKGKLEAARAALRRTVSAEQAERVLEEMQALQQEGEAKATGSGSLLQRKYVLPFVLACVVLVCNQTTGINSILQFLVVILRQAGMNARLATQGDVAVKLINCLATVVAVMLVDRKGRRYLLRIGTGGVVLALLACGFFFLRIEQGRSDVRRQVEAARSGNRLALALDTLPAGPPGRVMALTVTYSYGHGTQVETALSDNPKPVLTLAPTADEMSAPLSIQRAVYGPVPTTATGWMVAGCLGLFILFFAVGPGVVVWLMLSELMPTRIRSSGMGIAMLLNQGASTLIAAVFLPVVGFLGYYAMFFAWAGCTVIYFVTATFFLPETKGRTLEEIEMHFERAGEGVGR